MYRKKRAELWIPAPVVPKQHVTDDIRYAPKFKGMQGTGVGGDHSTVDG